jgi:hypothetical protein
MTDEEKSNGPCTLPIDEVQRLDRSLDVFEPSPGPDHELIEKKFYRPVRITTTRIVWGFGTIERIREHGGTEIACIRTPDRGETESLREALVEEDRAGRYSWFEIERIVPLAGGPDRIDRPIALLLFGERSESALARLRSFLALPPHARLLVTKSGIDTRTAAAAAELCEETIVRLIDDPAFLGLSQSERRITVELVAEIAGRDRPNDEEELAIVGKALSSQSPVETLRRMRFPHLCGMYNDLVAFRERHFAKSGIDLAPPPHFEGSSFRVSFSFSGKNEFAKKIRRLAAAEDDLDELFRLL